MAPELIKSEQNFNEKVDIWSLGCLVYYILSGKHAFYSPDQSLTDINQKILYEEPDFGELKQIASPDAVEFIENCLEKLPHKRAGAPELLQHAWLNQSESTIATSNDLTVETT